MDAGSVIFLDLNGGYIVVGKLVCFIIICKTIHLYFIHSSVYYVLYFFLIIFSKAL